MWGQGFGGFCPDSWEEVQIKGESLSACHLIDEQKGTETWGGFGKEVEDISWAARAVVNSPYQENREVITKIISNFEFYDKTANEKISILAKELCKNKTSLGLNGYEGGWIYRCGENIQIIPNLLMDAPSVIFDKDGRKIASCGGMPNPDDKREPLKECEIKCEETQFKFCEDIEPEEEFCGTSTKGSCTSSADCITGGCSGQVCQSKSEEPVITTCEWTDCYDETQYGLSCKCVENKCQWSK